MISQKMQYEQSPFKIDYTLPGLLRMNLNENLVLPSAFAKKAQRECEREIDPRFYPSELYKGEMKELRSLIAEYCGCSEWMVELGCGADQLIDLICRMKLSKFGDELITVNPTFSMYALRAGICGARTIEVSLGRSSQGIHPFPIDSKKIIEACKSPKSKLLVLASPNNPTASQYEIEQVRGIIESIPSQVFIILDEAYVEYGKYSATSLLRRYPKLIILRTFSKAFGLASHRVGYLLSSNSELKGKFENGYQYPFPLTAMAAALASKLLKRKDVILGYANETKKLRKELLGSLQDLRGKLRVVERSDANFVLVESSYSERIAKLLLRRYRIATKLLPNMIGKRSFVRITVGTRAMNSKLVASLEELIRVV